MDCVPKRPDIFLLNQVSKYVLHWRLKDRNWFAEWLCMCVGVYWRSADMSWSMIAL